MPFPILGGVVERCDGVDAGLVACHPRGHQSDLPRRARLALHCLVGRAGRPCVGRGERTGPEPHLYVSK